MNMKFQLRGISRNPSNRATLDGGCSESLNVYINNGELAPCVKPVIKMGFEGAVVKYIHKTNSYTNYIGISQESPLVLIAKSEGSSSHEKILILDEGEELRGFSNLGNILIVATNNTTHRFYYKDSYRYLGVEVPRPNVTFSVEHQDDVKLLTTCRRIQTFAPSLVEAFENRSSDADFWNAAVTFRDSNSGSDAFNDATNFIADAEQQLWATITGQRKLNANNKIFSAPVMARFALRLYSGDYLYISAPILFNGSESGDMNFFSFLGAALAQPGPADDGAAYWQWEITMRQLYKLSVSITFDNISETWKELIESVDIFFSKDLYCPQYNNSLYLASSLEGADTRFNVVVDYDKLDYNSLGKPAESIREDFKAKIDEIANFYLVKSYNINNLPTNEYIKPLTQDELLVKTALKDDEDLSIFTNEAPFVYNSRLIYKQESIKLPSGLPYPACKTSFPNRTEGETYYISIFYHVRDSYGIEHLVGGFQDFKVDASLNVSAYVAYPSVKCFQADLYVAKNNPLEIEYMVKLPMKEHPGLMCSYGFWGLDSNIWDNDTERVIKYTTSKPQNTQPSFVIQNQIFLSEVDNPFVFSTVNRTTTSGKIIDIAVATTALSSGQFGQYPIYVFTEDGIWAISINDVGGFSTLRPLSREVALPGTVSQIDQTVVFTTEKGVMFLAGSEIKDISQDMHGKHWCMSDSIKQLISASGYSEVLPALAGSDSFMAFMRNASCKYDYNGSRLIFFNKDYSYQYVYSLSGQTWHKLYFAFETTHNDKVYQLEFSNTLNSYPELMASYKAVVYSERFNYHISGITEEEKVAIANGIKEFTKPSVDINVPSSVGGTNLTYRDITTVCDQVYDDYTEVITEIDKNDGAITITGINPAYIRAFEDIFTDKSVTIEISSEERPFLRGFIADFSTPLNGDGIEATKIVVATRPFDLGQPDIYKKINKLILRKSTAKDNVKYILLGSNDGINFYRLLSLRGASWKMYQMIIVGELKPSERMSWIDFEFELRFTDKPR